MPSTRPRGTTLMAVAALVAAGSLAYANSLGGPFVYDDIPSIADNPSIRHLWPLGPVLFPAHGHGYTFEGRPLLNLSLALNYAFGATSVLGYHLVNALIHVLAGLALFGVVRRTLAQPAVATRFTAWSKRLTPEFAAWAIALLWLVHPLQTEAVTYVVQRAESLMGLFYLLTLYGFIRYAAGGRAGWAVASIVACVAGDATKEILVTAPVIVFFFDRTFVAGSFAAAWRRRRVYYVALAATWIPLGFLVASAGGTRNGSSGFGGGITWAGYVLTQFQAISRYLFLSVWPSSLVFDYGAFQTTATQALPYALLVVSLAAATLYALVRRPILGFLGFWFFGILAITSIVPGSSEMIVERRMYLPLAALIVLLVLGLARWAGQVALPLACGAAAVLAGLTWSRNNVYADDVALWKDGLRWFPDNSRGAYNLGVAYFNHHQPTEELAAYREAVRLDPRNARAQLSLANALLRQGRAPESLSRYESALSAIPNDAGAHRDFGTAYVALGRFPEAAAQFRAALSLDPTLIEARDSLGVALARSGHLPEAIEQFRAVAQQVPDRASAHANLGGALADQGQFAAAEAEYRRAVALDPSLALARVGLGNVLSQEGHFAEAIPHFETALAADPRNLALQQNLATAYIETGDAAAALPFFANVAQAEPNSGEAHHNLAAALAALGRNVEAARELQREADLPSH